jgi:PKD repeat protein
MQRILFIFVLLLSLAASRSQAQCPPCPRYFILTDSARCFSTEVSPNCGGASGFWANCNTLRICKNSRQVLTFTPVAFDPATGQPCTYPPFTYTNPTITGGTILSYGNNQITVQWGSANTGTLLIPFSTPGGGAGSAPCSDTMRIVVNLLNNPVAAFTATPQPACFNNPTSISFNSSASVGAVSYYWNFGDGFTSTLPNPVHNYTSPGTYNVCLVVSSSLPDTSFNPQLAKCPPCIDSICQPVVIDALPGPPIPCVATVCAGATETYCTSASGCTNYTWSVVGGTITGGQGTPCVTVAWGSGNPQGSLTLVATGCSTAYCPQGTTVNVPIVPVTGTITGSNPVCVGTTAAYSLPAFPGTTYGWSLSGGGAIAGNNTNTNQINIGWGNVPGSYTISCNYFDTALNCGGSASFVVNVLPVLRINGSNSQCEGTSSSLQASFGPPNTPVACNWTVTPAGASVTGGNGTPSATFSWASPGVYTVTATPVASGIVCGNATYTVTVHPAPVISAITGADSICPGQTYVYAATSNASGLFTWNVTNGSFSNLGANNDSVQVTWAASGPYSLAVQQFSYANNCPSNLFVKNIFPYPTPTLSGPVSVCADAIVTYTITNIASGNFNWFVTPPSFGTIISGQGTNTLTIKWHGNNSPGGSNTVYLHYGVCGNDSVAITINEPVPATITASGSLCAGGVTLSTGATGTFSWTRDPLAPIVPAQPTNLSSLTGLTQPGTYNVQIQNYNGSGCTVSATYIVPNVGLPIASISATGPLVYCLPSLPNMSLVAVPGVGYSYQWYQNAVPIPGATTSTLGINTGSPSVTITAAGTYTFYCVVSLGGCVVFSNPITISVTPGPCIGCTGAIQVTGITGCNPFTIGITHVSPPSAYIIPGTTSIFHWLSGSTVPGNVTNTFNVTGFQPIRVCATVKNNDSTTCNVCVDTTVLVAVAANFIANDSCGIVTFNNLSTVIAPVTIASYNWSVGTNPGNLPTFDATFNNNTIANPVMTVTASGSYIVTLTVTGSNGCVVSFMDTIQVTLADALFAPLPTCVGTPAIFSNPPSFTDFWDFGDAATSYVSPTSHAYAAPGVYAITHIVSNAVGCKDTVVKNILIFPAPTCAISYMGATTFCFGDSLVLVGCTGYTGYQWFNNGVAIGAPAGTQQNYTALQTGNYHFTAVDVNGCIVRSDTVGITVNQPPATSLTVSANRCVGLPFSVTAPSCAGCTYSWLVDNVANPATTNQLSGTIGVAPLSVGTHTITVIVTNALGCSATDSVTVTFFANPTVSIATAGPVPFCGNNLYTFTATTNAASPSWAWNYNNMAINLSSTNTLLGSAAGSYAVYVTDGITGCKASASQSINPSPELNLFPVGCDTLCDTAHVFLPLGSLNGNLAGYNISWYDNAPPYLLPVGSGPVFNLNSLPPGSHNLSVIVIGPNGCADTSNVYSLYTINCSILSVKDLRLGARRMGNQGLLNWSVAEEQNNDYFVVEYSTDGTRFADLGRVNSRGNSLIRQYYAYNHSLAGIAGVVYYRIRAVDKNGSVSYSNTVQLRPDGRDAERITVVPNATTGGATVAVYSQKAVNTVLRVLDAQGRAVVNRPVVLAKGLNMLPLDMGGLAKGLYHVVVTAGEGLLKAPVVKL